MKDFDSCATLLENHGIRPTANRLLVAKAMLNSNTTLSIKDIEDRIDTMDKSSVFRVLRLFAKHKLTHEIDDGTGSTKYEICHSHHEHHDDQHVHFYCTSCQRTICLDDIPVPNVQLPHDYSAQTTNYVIKGVCAKCNKK